MATTAKTLRTKHQGLWGDCIWVEGVRYAIDAVGHCEVSNAAHADFLDGMDGWVGVEPAPAPALAPEIKRSAPKRSAPKRSAPKRQPPKRQAVAADSED